MGNDKAISEPVCHADRCGKSASRSQIIILLKTHWQKVTVCSTYVLCFWLDICCLTADRLAQLVEHWTAVPQVQISAGQTLRVFK